jgi:hypothetical protein
MMGRMITYPPAAAMAWDLAGRPWRATLPDPAGPGLCAVCGTIADASVPVTATAGSKTFTDQHLLAAPWSPVTCPACAWALSGKPPHSVRLWTLACAPGSDLGASHPKSQQAVPGGHPGLLLTARNDMRPVAALLCDPPDGPWCVAVAESGQKHSLPWTSVNHGAGRWHVRMDALDVHGTPRDFSAILGHVTALREAGFPSAAIEAVDPGGRLNAENLPAWREHAAALSPWRRSPPLRLACFIPSKEHMDDFQRIAGGGGHARRAA